uniref:Uncharacterized protein n=1 Tax=Glossina brevipalpis TaxID=37001 RepID=A0A1A9WQ76_9MUSC
MTSYSQNDNYFNEIDALSYNSRPISSTLHSTSSYNNYDGGGAKSFFHTYDNALYDKQYSSTSNGVNYQKPFTVPMTVASNGKNYEKDSTMNVQSLMATDNLMFHHNAYSQEDSNKKTTIFTNCDDDGGSGIKNDDEYECNDYWSFVNHETQDALHHTLKTLPKKPPEQSHSSSAIWGGMYNKPPSNCDGGSASLPPIPDVGVGADRAEHAWGRDYNHMQKRPVIPPCPNSDESTATSYGFTTVCGSSIGSISANKFLPVVPLRTLSRPQVNACINLKRQLFEDTSSGMTAWKDAATTSATINNQYNYNGDSAHIIHTNSSASDYTDYCLKESCPQMAVHKHQSSFDAEYNYSGDNMSIYSDTAAATTTTNVAPHKLHELQKRRYSIIQAMTTASVIASGETRIPPQQLSKKLGGTSKILKSSASHAIDQMYATKDNNRETKNYTCENSDILVTSRSSCNSTAFSSVTFATSTSILLSSSSPIVASQTPTSAATTAVSTLSTTVKKLPKRLPAAPIIMTTRLPSFAKQLPQPPPFLLNSSSCFSKDDKLPNAIASTQSLSATMTQASTEVATKTTETPEAVNALPFLLPMTSLTSLSSSPTSIPFNSTTLTTTTIPVETSSPTYISQASYSSILTTTKTTIALETIVTATGTASPAKSFDSSTLLLITNENNRLHFNNDSNYDNFSRATVENAATKNNNNNDNDFFDLKKYDIKPKEALITEEAFADEFIANKICTLASAPSSTYIKSMKTEISANSELETMAKNTSTLITPISTIPTTLAESTTTYYLSVQDAFDDKRYLNPHILSTTYSTSSSSNLIFPSFLSISKPASTFLDSSFVNKSYNNTVESDINLQSLSSQLLSRDVSLNNNFASNTTSTSSANPVAAIVSDSDTFVLEKAFGHSNFSDVVSNDYSHNTNENSYFKSAYTKYSCKNAFPDEKSGTCYTTTTSVATAHTPPLLPTAAVTLITAESSILPPISSSVTIASPCSLTLTPIATTNGDSKPTSLSSLSKSDDFVKARVSPSRAATLLATTTACMRDNTLENVPQVGPIDRVESSTLNNSCPIITTTNCSSDVMMSSSLTSLYTNSMLTTIITASESLPVTTSSTIKKSIPNTLGQPAVDFTAITYEDYLNSLNSTCGTISTTSTITTMSATVSAATSLPIYISDMLLTSFDDYSKSYLSKYKLNDNDISSSLVAETKSLIIDNQNNASSELAIEERETETPVSISAASLNNKSDDYLNFKTVDPSSEVSYSKTSEAFLTTVGFDNTFYASYDVDLNFLMESVTTTSLSEVQQTVGSVTTSTPLVSKTQVSAETGDNSFSSPIDSNVPFFEVSSITDANCNATTSRITTDAIKVSNCSKPPTTTSRSELTSLASSVWAPHKSSTATTNVVGSKTSNMLGDFSKGLKDGLDGFVIGGRTTSCNNSQQPSNVKKGFSFSFPSKLVPNVGSLLGGSNKHVSTATETTITTISNTAINDSTLKTLTTENSAISASTTPSTSNNYDLRMDFSSAQSAKEEYYNNNSLSLNERIPNNNIYTTTVCSEDKREINETADLYKTIQSSTCYHVTSSDDYDSVDFQTSGSPSKSVIKMYDADIAATNVENGTNFSKGYDKNGCGEDQILMGSQFIDDKQTDIAISAPCTPTVTTETIKTTKKTKNNLLSSLSQAAPQISSPPTAKTTATGSGAKSGGGGMFGSFLGKAAAAVQSATQAVNQGASIASAVVQKVPSSNMMKGQEQQKHQLSVTREIVPATNEAKETDGNRQVTLEQQYLHIPYTTDSGDGYDDSNLHMLDYEQKSEYQTNDHPDQTQMKLLPTVPATCTGKKLPTINTVKSGYLMKQQPTETYDTDEEDVLIIDNTVDIRSDLDYNMDDEQHEYNITSQKLTDVLDSQRLDSHVISSYYEHANGGYDYRDDYFNEEDEYKYLQDDEDKKQMEAQQILKVNNGGHFYLSPKDESRQQHSVYQKSLQYSDEDVHNVELSLDYVDDMYPSEDSGNYLDESSSGSVAGIYPSSSAKTNRSPEVYKGTTQAENLVTANVTTILANQLQTHQQIRKQNSIIMEEDELSPILLSDKSGVSPAKSLSRKSSNVLLMDDVDEVHDLTIYSDHKISQIRKNKLIRCETEEVVSGHMQIIKRKPEISARQRWHWAFNKIIIQLNVSKQ